MKMKWGFFFECLVLKKVDLITIKVNNNGKEKKTEYPHKLQ